VPSFEKREKPAEMAHFCPPVPGPGGNPVPPGGKHPHAALPPLAARQCGAGATPGTLPARIRDNGGAGTSQAPDRATPAPRRAADRFPDA